ncbi:serine/threonine-protein kinase [Enhygromyxa salina]|nr:serine/threonine-protein kinase [Enhygromyxa salina]
MPSATDTDPLVGQLLDGRYRVEGLIGAGGMGRVYRAVRDGLGKLVAIKVLPLEIKASERETLVARFTREAQATASIRHRNVVEILDFGQTADCVYFVMELLEGQTLASLVGHGRRLSLARLVPIAQQTAAGLQSAHELGIIHRDVKPANIFIEITDSGDRVKILDFGLAKLNDGLKLTEAGMIFGTASYMSPEQAHGGKLDLRTDIYAYGCVLFEAITGRPPFQGDSFMEILGKHLRVEPPAIRELCPTLELPEELTQLVVRALAKRPDDRFPNMDTIQAALSSIDVPPPPPPPRRPSRTRTSPVLAPLGFLFVAFAYSTDSELATSEVEHIAKELSEWAPGLDPGRVRESVDAVVNEYERLQTESRREARTLAVTEELAQMLSVEERRRVLGCLWRIAGADGKILETERRFIMTTVERFDMTGTKKAAPAPEPEPEPEHTEIVPAAFEEQPEERTEIIPAAFDDRAPADLVGFEDGEPREPSLIVPLAIEAPTLARLPDELPLLAPAPGDEPPPRPSGERNVDADTDRGLTVELLRRSFDTCATALEQMQADGTPLVELSRTSLAEWTAGLQILRLDRTEGVYQLALSVLDDADVSLTRRASAALVLLCVQGRKVASMLLDHLAEDGESSALEPIAGALELWQDQSQHACLLRGLDESNESARPRWIEALARCAIDPGPTYFADWEAPRRDDELAPLLRLLAFHAGRDAHKQRIMPFLFSQNAGVRSAALLTGIIIDTPGAVLMSKRLARDPSYAELCLLHALFATDHELAALADWGCSEEAPEHAGLVLGYCGRRRGIEAALGRFQVDQSPGALAGFRFATGYEGPAGEVESWWSANASRFGETRRYLLGRELDPAGFMGGVQRADGRLWRALASECLVSSRGQVRLPVVGFPDTLLAHANGLDAASLDWLG